MEWIMTPKASCHTHTHTHTHTHSVFPYRKQNAALTVGDSARAVFQPNENAWPSHDSHTSAWRIRHVRKHKPVPPAALFPAIVIDRFLHGQNKWWRLQLLPSTVVISAEEIVHPKINILSFTHSHATQNTCDLFLHGTPKKIPYITEFWECTF